MLKQCCFCGNTLFQKYEDTSENKTTTNLICLNCITNNYAISYIDISVFDTLPFTNIRFIAHQYNYICLLKLTEIINHDNRKFLKNFFSIRRVIYINNNTYSATDIYHIGESDPYSLQKHSNIPFHNSLCETNYNNSANFIDIIKSCKSPEDAVNTINTLFLFS